MMGGFGLDLLAQMGHIDTAFAQALQHRQAVHVWQAQIKDHHVRAMLGRFGDALLSIRGFQNPVAVGIQAHAQQAAQLQFIIDDEHGGFESGRCLYRLVGDGNDKLVQPFIPPTSPGTTAGGNQMGVESR